VAENSVQGTIQNSRNDKYKHKLWEYERLYSFVESSRANCTMVIPDEVDVALKLSGNLY